MCVCVCTCVCVGVCVCVCIQDVTEAYADDMALARQRRNLPDVAVAQALVDAQARCVPPEPGVWTPRTWVLDRDLAP
jgi:hypothetical protein